MRIGFHSPMPPARTGVADYSAALLRALSRHEPDFARRLAVNPTAPCDLEIYHSGNNGLHTAIHQAMRTNPGVTVLHDAVLHHFFLGAGNETEYANEFVSNYGDWHRGLAARFWRRRAASGGDPEYFRYPMLRGVVGNARLVIAHNAAAARAAREHGAGTVEILPHLFEAPEIDSVATARVRERFAGAALVCGVFGHLRETKRLIPAAQAVEAVRKRGFDMRLVAAGEFASDDLARAAAPWLARDWIVRLPYLDERDFWTWAAAVDVCINLRYPAAGETSGIGIRVMGIGKCVIATAGEETAAIPDNACLRAEPGLGENESLEALLLLLADRPDYARQTGVAARAHIAREHSAAAVTRRFRELIEAVSPAP
ncbi:MAG: glycosyltransferase [Bryobacteraceae bacterium]